MFIQKIIVTLPETPIVAAMTTDESVQSRRVSVSPPLMCWPVLDGNTGRRGHTLVLPMNRNDNAYC